MTEEKPFLSNKQILTLIISHGAAVQAARDAGLHAYADGMLQYLSRNGVDLPALVKQLDEQVEKEKEAWLAKQKEEQSNVPV